MSHNGECVSFLTKSFLYEKFKAELDMLKKNELRQVVEFHLVLQAVASVGVASDRVCIASQGKVQSLLSEQDAVSCCPICGDCFGGFPIRVLHYWTTQGLVTGKSLMILTSLALF